MDNLFKSNRAIFCVHNNHEPYLRSFLDFFSDKYSWQSKLFIQNIWISSWRENNTLEFAWDLQNHVERFIPTVHYLRDYQYNIIVVQKDAEIVQE